MATALIGLGANLGDRGETIREALDALASLAGCENTQSSRLYESAPAGGPPHQPRFLNAALRMETALPPQALWARLQALEQRLGRQRGARWAARTIDLDLLAFGEHVIRTPALTVPHRRMTFRRFVLAPACDVAGSFRHPTTGTTLRELVAHLDSTRNYVAIAGGLTDQTLLDQLASEEPPVAVARGGERLPPGPLPEAAAAARILAQVETARAALEACPQDQFLVSGFWAPGSRLWMDADQARKLPERVTAALAGAPQAKLVVLPASLPGTSASHAPRARLAERVRASGPHLELESDDPHETLAELRAALQALRPEGVQPLEWP